MLFRVKLNSEICLNVTHLDLGPKYIIYSITKKCGDRMRTYMERFKPLRFFFSESMQSNGIFLFTSKAEYFYERTVKVAVLKHNAVMEQCRAG